MRIGQRVTDTCLRREVNDLAKAFRREQLRHPLAVGDVHLLEAESRKCPERGDASRFQAGIVVRIEIVYPDNVTALLQQAMRDVHADEAGCAGDQNSIPHINALLNAAVRLCTACSSSRAEAPRPSMPFRARRMLFRAV